MARVELSIHARDMLAERGIAEEWMWRAINAPDRAQVGANGNTHYIKAIAEHGGRVLRVIVNHHVAPERVVTAFFDRRLRRQG